MRNVQPMIFENISNMLEDLEQSKVTKAFAAHSLDDELTFNYMSICTFY